MARVAYDSVQVSTNCQFNNKQLTGFLACGRGGREYILEYHVGILKGSKRIPFKRNRPTKAGRKGVGAEKGWRGGGGGFEK